MSGLLPAFGLGMAVLAGSAQAQTAPIRVQDDRGRAVVLAEPARRAVTLAPHATELVYAAGAGDRIAATIRGSDYPPPRARCRSSAMARNRTRNAWPPSGPT